MNEGKKEVSSFSNKLIKLLNNKEFINLVNSIADEDEADNINYNEYKEELLQLRQLNQKKRERIK